MQSAPHYDGQPAPTAGARGLLRATTGSCSRATKEAHLMAARQSAINTAHCSLKITERCTMKLTVVAVPWAMTKAMICTLSWLRP
jgi:hypothetical protein